MTTVSELRKDLRLGIVIVSGAFGRQDLEALISFYGSEAAAKCDHVCIWLPDADISGLTAEMTVELKDRLVAATAAYNHSMILRSAAVCLSQETVPFVEAWVANSNPKDGLYNDTRLFLNLETAVEWLQLTATEKAELNFCIASLTAIASRQHEAA